MAPFNSDHCAHSLSSTKTLRGLPKQDGLNFRENFCRNFPAVDYFFNTFLCSDDAFISCISAVDVQKSAWEMNERRFIPSPVRRNGLIMIHLWRAWPLLCFSLSFFRYFAFTPSRTVRFFLAPSPLLSISFGVPALYTRLHV